MLKYPAPLRAIPYGAPPQENRLLRIPMIAPSYGGTDTPLVEIPYQVLFSFTVHHFLEPNRPAEWIVGTMEGSLLVMRYHERCVRFIAPSNTPEARFESDAYDVDDFLMMDRNYTRRLLYDMALAS
ncbi:hypothetical protein TK90_2672 (plasmid) [Thioalkalivibrio sp. K90mix]|uniref:hypothetical protein n=1 Tax=Thioalkalivibrio sp. (strain K90mix) TaxID=396595 RepID=UPI000195A3BD|nr:hypothetical protein [Thioalkalivibrio sp. K90mix]ADC73159.1 hypothetical protein TK90_2672 [Thioalkalivibrio sp. K90mix]